MPTKEEILKLNKERDKLAILLFLKHQQPSKSFDGIADGLDFSRKRLIFLLDELLNEEKIEIIKPFINSDIHYRLKKQEVNLK